MMQSSLKTFLQRSENTANGNVYKRRSRLDTHEEGGEKKKRKKNVQKKTASDRSSLFSKGKGAGGRKQAKFTLPSKPGPSHYNYTSPSSTNDHTDSSIDGMDTQSSASCSKFPVLCVAESVGNPHDSECRPPMVSTAATISKNYTPLEQQYITIKAQYPDAVLCVECGYKYRFFGEDAEIAAKTLNIVCFQDHNFKAAMIPVHRLYIHLRRLVVAGYKVGVVKQTETAALKAASQRKSGPFSRELSGLYTRATLLGPDVEPPSGQRVELGEEEEEESGMWMMCVCEGDRKAKGKSGPGKSAVTTIGFLAVQPAVGNIVYEEFTDSSAVLSELDLRLSHLQPVELLYSRQCSQLLHDTLQAWKKYGGKSGVRVEQLAEEWFDYNNAFTTVTEFYGRDGKEKKEEKEEEEEEEEEEEKKQDQHNFLHSPPSSQVQGAAEALCSIINLPPVALCCLGALIHHLRVFKLQQVLKLTSNLQPFSIGSHCMRLNTSALETLEVFHNSTDRKENGSLFRVLNHTRTSFGRRLLRKWLCYPLRSAAQLRQRQAAITELSSSESLCVPVLRSILTKLPDLERMLCCAYHKKCSPLEFCVLMSHLSDVSSQLVATSEMAFKDLHSDLLKQIIKEVPGHLQGCDTFLAALHQPAARNGRFEDLFTNIDTYPTILKEKEAIVQVKQRLQEHRKRFRVALGCSNLDYVTVSGVQYLVEVSNKDICKVPSDWTRISGTKRVTRFHPPYVLEDVQLLAQHSDQLVISARGAWSNFLSNFSAKYGAFKKAVDLLAMLDCLFSLAKVALMPGYVCPTIVEEPLVEVEAGRHPIIHNLLGEGEQYVPNDTKLSSSGMYAMIITGPNMGGKSSYIKQVALICIMSQIGSFVPAASATLGLLDAVYTRMGASDRICAGKSTFMMELLEASEMMRLATPHSLVIVDELGRGTSTHDGTAVAWATLRHFIQEVRSLTLFVTHYPVLAQLESTFPGAVGNFHMSYVETGITDEGYEKIAFLYQLEKGQAGKSYGLNVAALAGLDTGILRVAAGKSRELERCGGSRSAAGGSGLALREQRLNTFRKIVSLVQQGCFDPKSIASMLS